MKIGLIFLFCLILMVGDGKAQVNGYYIFDSSNIQYSSFITKERLFGSGAQQFNLSGQHGGYVEVIKTIPAVFQSVEHFFINAKPKKLTQNAILWVTFFVKKPGDSCWFQAISFFIHPLQVDSWVAGYSTFYPNFTGGFSEIKIRFRLEGNNLRKISSSIILDRFSCQNDNNSAIIDEFESIIAGTEIKEPGKNPEKFSLSQNYPNPFNPVTQIKFAIPKKGFVTLKVYNVLGKEIKTLVDEFRSAGNYSINFNGSNLPSGNYFYRMTMEDFSDVKSMILIK